MKDRKKYSPLSAIQKSLSENATAILADGAIVKDVTRLSSSGRMWVGTVASGKVGLRADGQAAQFNQEDVIEVADLPVSEAEESGGSPAVAAALATKPRRKSKPKSKTTS